MSEEPRRSGRSELVSPFADLQLPLDGCSILQITVGRLDVDPACELRFETWPDTVQARFTTHFKEWRAANPTAAIVAQTYAITDAMYFVALHLRKPA